MPPPATPTFLSISRRRRAAFLLAGSLVFGLLVLANNYVLTIAYDGTFTSREAILSFSRGAEWIVVGPALVAVLRRISAVGVSWLTRVGIYIGAAFVFHTLTEVAHTALAFAIGPASTMDPIAFYWGSWRNAALFHLISYAAVGGVMYGYDRHIQAIRLLEANRAREIREAHLESELAQAQLHALRMQLNPHFLFNALSAVAALTRQDPARARRVLVDLGELLRLALDTTEEEVPLRDELVFVDRYLRIEQVRMGGRLRVHVRVDPDTLDALVPPLLLQPLLENAIKHGVAPLEEGGNVDLASIREADELVVTVRDTGRGLSAGACSGRGIGLENVRRRLDRLHGPDATLSIESAPGRGLTATVRLPFRIEHGARHTSASV